ncbi:uncharacterized protein PRCAT00002653001 [Priceomyces carsonii]|uniref:uncharacterized protein n=1 Tax=Priceomyces carsonii TaxID=28549 RepID=UPI002EDAAD0F|nr:unnamed protein product [Priceomyces carsonii]
MNVSGNGYYTTRYLDLRKEGTRSQSRYASLPRQCSGSSYEPKSEMIIGEWNRTPYDEQDISEVGSTVYDKNDEVSTMEFSKQGNVADNAEFGERESEQEDYDPDYLEQEITPAQLNILQSSYRPYRVTTRPPYATPQRHIENPLQQYHGYYIQQKKRIDSSPYKPKFYTHKTFREVFQDAEEDTCKYNPMEFVFQDQPEEKKLKKAVNILRGKKANYDNDYYQNLQRLPRQEKSTPPVVFSQQETTSVEENESKRAKKSRNLKLLWKKRSNPEKTVALLPPAIAQADNISNEVFKEGNMNIELTPEVASDQTEVHSPNNQFHPLWNYILSWIVYNPNITDGEELSIPSIDSAEEVVKEDGGRMKKSLKLKKKDRPKLHRQSKDNIKGIKKNYSMMVSKWNQPLSVVFDGNEAGKMSLRATPEFSSSTRLIKSSGDGNSQEFVIEIEDDEDDSVDEELYYNPITKSLERVPVANGNTSPLDGPKVLISNVGNLIKKLKIMRLIFAPIDIVGNTFPSLQTFVIIAELVIFVWLLYELSLLIDSLCMMVKAVCAPMIAMGRLMNRIM